MDNGDDDGGDGAIAVSGEWCRASGRFGMIRPVAVNPVE